MRELLHIQADQGENQVGSKFWELICEEHRLDNTWQYHGEDPEELKDINIYFKETLSGKYVPCSVLIDLDPDSIDAIRSGPLENLFIPNDYIHGHLDAGNNWAKGFIQMSVNYFLIAFVRTLRKRKNCSNFCWKFYCYTWNILKIENIFGLMKINMLLHIGILLKK